MKCEEFEERLNRVLDQRQRPEWDAELLLHCDHCAECRELAGLYGVLLDGFYALATPEPATDLPIRVIDELRVRPATTGRARIVTAVLATAAAVLVALVPWMESSDNRLDSGARAPGRPVALASEKSEALSAWNEIDAMPVVGPVLVSMSDDDAATDPYAALAKGTGQGLASVVLYIPRIGSSPGALSVAPDVVNGEPAWPQRMSESLKPVTESVGETLDLLLRALPLSESTRS
jgi:hypothetical protein